MKKTLLFVTLIFLMTSCATIISGSKQNIKINSTPTNAFVFVDGKQQGKTPLETKLERKSNHNIAIKLEGYNDFNIRLEKKMNGWLWGNILAGGIIGYIVDLSTGAVYRLTPKEINQQLGKTVASRLIKDNIYVFATLDAEVSSDKIGQLVKR